MANKKRGPKKNKKDVIEENRELRERLRRLEERELPQRDPQSGGSQLQQQKCSRSPQRGRERERERATATAIGMKELATSLLDIAGRILRLVESRSRSPPGDRRHHSPPRRRSPKLNLKAYKNLDSVEVTSDQLAAELRTFQQTEAQNQDPDADTPILDYSGPENLE
ncbi:hypothetical protein TWF506_005445 [Arthrobotrys conoides]|uniref:Uncharacterized protein n=1 Tax=Arthrobotrys conoides TaxID=74498 RepID=A0AAN8NBU9_9PEZI